MTTVKLKAYVHRPVSGYSDDQFAVFGSADMSNCGYFFVGSFEFDYEIPADFNPVAAEVAMLNKELDRLNDEHTSKVRQIKGRIQELLCIENSPSQS